VRIANVASTEPLQAQRRQWSGAWQQQAHPWQRSTPSVAKVMAKAPAMAA
jgi:hypothetical protein